MKRPLTRSSRLAKVGVEVPNPRAGVTSARESDARGRLPDAALQALLLAGPRAPIAGPLPRAPAPGRGPLRQLHSAKRLAQRRPHLAHLRQLAKPLPDASRREFARVRHSRCVRFPPPTSKMY